MKLSAILSINVLIIACLVWVTFFPEGPNDFLVVGLVLVVLFLTLFDIYALIIFLIFERFVKPTYYTNILFFLLLLLPFLCVYLYIS